jgi:flagellin FlaB
MINLEFYSTYLKMEEEKEKKAAQGIGTLIIFIAMILVAAVAAGVLIQTAASLQSKSLDVGRQSQEKITTDIEVVQVFAYDTQDGMINGSIDNLSITVRLGSASTPIKLSDTLIKFDSSVASKSSNYRYSGGTNFSESTFGVNYLITGPSSVPGYITTGDSVEILVTVEAGNNIAEAQRMTLRIIPKNGAIKPVEMTMPSAVIDPVTYLYP